jgi:hypothetical protein
MGKGVGVLIQQAVALGKPVVVLAGTYRRGLGAACASAARASLRLHGTCAQPAA